MHTLNIFEMSSAHTRIQLNVWQVQVGLPAVSLVKQMNVFTFQCLELCERQLSPRHQKAGHLAATYYRVLVLSSYASWSKLISHAIVFYCFMTSNVSLVPVLALAGLDSITELQQSEGI